MLGSAILSGCSLVTTDYASYYKAVVASATIREGKEIEITKKDLRDCEGLSLYYFSVNS